MFNLFKKREKVEGEIGYFNLQDWWLTTFTEKERDHIQEILQNNSLTNGKISSTSQTSGGLLMSLAGWFNNPRDRYLAKKIIEKAYQESKKSSNILDLHFTLHTITEIYYPDRDSEPNAWDKAIKACEEQISIAPQAAKGFLKIYSSQELPAHTGYNQLVIILKKQGNYKRAIQLCEQAREQEWSGDWENKIEDIKKKQK